MACDSVALWWKTPEIRRHDTDLTPIQNRFLAFLVKPIDKTVVVELFNHAHVGEVFGLG
jgi:hypothetical protein